MLCCAVSNSYLTVMVVEPMGAVFLLSEHLLAVSFFLFFCVMQFISKWKKEHAGEIWCENVRTKEKKKLWRRKNVSEPFSYPWKEIKM